MIKKIQTVLLNNKYRYSINQIVTTPYGRLRFVPNKYYKMMILFLTKFYLFIRNPKNVAQGLLGGLKVEASSKLSSVIELSYRDEVPQRARRYIKSIYSCL